MAAMPTPVPQVARPARQPPAKHSVATAAKVVRPVTVEPQQLAMPKPTAAMAKAQQARVAMPLAVLAETHPAIRPAVRPRGETLQLARQPAAMLPAELLQRVARPQAALEPAERLMAM